MACSFWVLSGVFQVVFFCLFASSGFLFQAFAWVFVFPVKPLFWPGGGSVLGDFRRIFLGFISLWKVLSLDSGMVAVGVF